MALTAKSLILYGFEVDQFNSSIDFRSVVAGPILQASVPFGFYALGGLMDAVIAAMKAVSPLQSFSYSIDRTLSGGTQNRVTLSTSTGHLDLLFATGPRTSSTIAPLIGFNIADYTGSVTYTGAASAGITLIPELNGYNYLGPEFNRMVKGAVNVSSSGIKEAVTFNIQKFIQVQFQHEPQTRVMTEWLDLTDWIIQQREFEFTPEISFPTVFYRVVIEKTSLDGKGLGMKFSEMLPMFPFDFDTGLITMRVRE